MGDGGQGARELKNNPPSAKVEEADRKFAERMEKSSAQGES